MFQRARDLQKFKEVEKKKTLRLEERQTKVIEKKKAHKMLKQISDESSEGESDDESEERKKVKVRFLFGFRESILSVSSHWGAAIRSIRRYLWPIVRFLPRFLGECHPIGRITRFFQPRIVPFV